MPSECLVSTLHQPPEAVARKTLAWVTAARVLAANHQENVPGLIPTSSQRMPGMFLLQAMTSIVVTKIFQLDSSVGVNLDCFLNRCLKLLDLIQFLSLGL